MGNRKTKHKTVVLDLSHLVDLVSAWDLREEPVSQGQPEQPLPPLTTREQYTLEKLLSNAWDGAMLAKYGKKK